MKERTMDHVRLFLEIINGIPLIYFATKSIIFIPPLITIILLTILMVDKYG